MNTRKAKKVLNIVRYDFCVELSKAYGNLLLAEFARTVSIPEKYTKKYT